MSGSIVIYVRMILTALEIFFDTELSLVFFNIKCKLLGVEIRQRLYSLPAIEVHSLHSDTFDKCGWSGSKASVPELHHCIGQIFWLVEGSRAN
jgi:hypothetical protein